MSRVTQFQLSIVASLLLLAGTFNEVQALPLRAAIVSLSLWDDQVFRSEAEGAANELGKRYGNNGPLIVRANTPGKMANSPTGIASALKDAAQGVEPDRDPLIFFLTSHGTPDGLADRGGGSFEFLTPAEIGKLMDDSTFKHRVLIVSACSSGIYLPLASPDTLVITASKGTRQSFGCQTEKHWTYFGDIFFEQALKQSASLAAAFANARTLVAAREAQLDFEPSEPQMAGGQNVLPILDELAAH